MNEMESTEHVTMSKLVQDFKVVAQDAEALMKETAGELGDRAREARQRLATSLGTFKENYARVEERARERAAATDKVIRAHPYESVGISFGIGLLIGVLVSRK